MPTCCGTVIENYALGNKFFVCTECHQEVTPMPSTTPDSFKAVTGYVPDVRQVSYTFGTSVRPGTPLPVAVELVEQLELFEPWIDGETLSFNDKDDDNV